MNIDSFAFFFNAGVLHTVVFGDVILEAEDLGVEFFLSLAFRC